MLQVAADTFFPAGVVGGEVDKHVAIAAGVDFTLIHCRVTVRACDDAGGPELWLTGSGHYIVPFTLLAIRFPGLLCAIAVVHWRRDKAGHCAAELLCDPLLFGLFNSGLNLLHQLCIALRDQQGHGVFWFSAVGRIWRKHVDITHSNFTD